jgi:anti-sigma regulatory factor (Ser/Thr protein kinase)
MAVDFTLKLSPELSAPAHARRAVVSCLTGRVGPERLNDVAVVISELVTNAVVHGYGEVVVRLQLDRGLLRGEVIDQGAGFEHEIRERGAEDIGGRGLFLVESMASRWGIHEGTTHVWFEIPTGSDAHEGLQPPRIGEDERPAALD